ncbi:MAG: EF-hand domain-containing protein [Candidatus Thiodiazotropha sp.]
MLLTVPGLLVAQDQLTPRGPIPFAIFDLDGNGAISQQEFESVHAQRRTLRNELGYPMGRTTPPFRSFDSNDDGLLSKKELLAGQHRNQMMRGGGMRPGKMGGHQMPTFSDFDLNRDGVLEQNEFQEARAKRISERASQGYQLRNLANAPSFATIDSDSNGVITPNEFSAAQAAHRQQRLK